MNKYSFLLKDGSTREYEEHELVCFGSISRKFGMLIMVLGILLTALVVILMLQEGRFDFRGLLGLFLVWYGWKLWKAAPRPDENTIKDGFRTYKGRAEAKDILGYRILGSYLWLLDETGNKVGKIKSIERKEN